MAAKAWTVAELQKLGLTPEQAKAAFKLVYEHAMDDVLLECSKKANSGPNSITRRIFNEVGAVVRRMKLGGPD